MAEFINTIDVLGDDAVIDSIIDRTITEFADDRITTVGSFAFSGCGSLAKIDLPYVETVGASAFYNCSSLVSVNLPNLVSTGGSMFQSCNALTSLDLPNLVTVGGDGFAHMGGIEKLVLPSVTSVSSFAFRNGSFKYIDFPKLNSIHTSSFYACGKLVTLILRSDTVVSLGGTYAFDRTPIDPDGTHNPGAIKYGTGYIYVPKALVDSYKSATNWTDFATQFRALEDYTVDGTTTGDLGHGHISYSLSSVNCSNMVTHAIGGYSAILTSAIGGSISEVRITMGDADITEDVYDHLTGEILIARITGDISIYAKSVYASDYEFNYLYELPTQTTFNGTSDYIDTGIKLFDTEKSFTIICEAEFSKVNNANICLFHCMNEATPYPGLVVDGKVGIRICYTGDSSLTTPISDRNAVTALAIRYNNGVLDAIMYKNTSGEIVSVSHNTSATYRQVTQNLLLGAYQTTAGVKGRYYNGTISVFRVYDGYLPDEIMMQELTDI